MLSHLWPKEEDFPRGGTQLYFVWVGVSDPKDRKWGGGVVERIAAKLGGGGLLNWGFF